MLNKLMSLLFRANALYPALDRSQAIIEFRPDGTIMRANDNFLAVMEYQLSEIRGKHHRIFVDDSERTSTRYKDFWDALRAARSGSENTGAVNSVGKKPGPMALALIPSFDQASAIARVNWPMPAFEAP